MTTFTLVWLHVFRLCQILPVYLPTHHNVHIVVVFFRPHHIDDCVQGDMKKLEAGLFHHFSLGAFLETLSASHSTLWSLPGDHFILKVHTGARSEGVLWLWNQISWNFWEQCCWNSAQSQCSIGCRWVDGWRLCFLLSVSIRVLKKYHFHSIMLACLHVSMYISVMASVSITICKRSVHVATGLSAVPSL